MALPNRTALAIWLSLLALLLFDLMGLIIKHLSDDYAAAELSAYRNFFGMIPSALVLYFSRSWHESGRPLKVRQWWLSVIRGGSVTIAQFMFYLSLAHIAFATATTITYANAIFVTALSVPLLGERVGWVRWSAVMVGFAGVVMVMGPGRDAFSAIAILPMISAFFYAVAAVTARLVDDDVPSALLNVHTQGIACLGALVLALSLGGFSPVQSVDDMLWIVAMGICGGCAVLCLIYAYRMTEPANLAPFGYFGIPLAFVLGWLFFREAPWADLFPGSILIAAGGLLIVWRERQLKRRAAQHA